MTFMGSAGLHPLREFVPLCNSQARYGTLEHLLSLRPACMAHLLGIGKYDKEHELVSRRKVRSPNGVTD